MKVADFDDRRAPSYRCEANPARFVMPLLPSSRWHRRILIPMIFQKKMKDFMSKAANAYLLRRSLGRPDGDEDGCGNGECRRHLIIARLGRVLKW